ncbi:sensor histidine kinase [Sphingomicrobium aestuariivivum]|uniref:sensor histidine kinase n=1 Tax=Sphingomicrobium aestuariivivum TaxID=1582356 RepID=UPI001FD65FCE|nr:ATP-binding protein [Sphingomicrobium aestuariivivum]MCJ8191569.1 ATP-binding protein [Sphingomicrobium aestuariivivum]
MRGRLSLSAQVALIVALAILVAQSINFVMALHERRDRLIDEAVLPAAERLATVAELPQLLDRAERGARFRDARARRLGREGRRPPARRADIGREDPVPAIARPVPVAEALVKDRFERAGVEAQAIKAGLIPPPPHPQHAREARGELVLAARLEDGRWISLRVPGPEPLRPLVHRLVMHSLLVVLLVLVPTLLVLRSTASSLRRVTRAAERFDGRSAAPLAETGPRDVAALARALNDMQARITAMVSEKDVMLGAIGHDLRTPLTALRIEAEGVEDEAQRAALVEQVERLHAQFEAILELARSNRPLGPDQWVDTGPMLDRLAHQYEGRAVTIEPASPTRFPGDEAAVLRALANLIDNGLRHGNSVTLMQGIDGDRVSFRVEDEGPGIAEAERERLMRPFERGDESRNRATGGHGLGLAIVAAIMRRHRGTLRLADRADGKPGLAALLRFPHLPQDRQRLH